MHIATQTIPHPLQSHLESLNIPPPASGHEPSFFSLPPEDGPLGHIITQARAYIHYLLPPWAENHVYRVYAEGLAIAEITGWSKGQQAEALGWDQELWFLTALLHDIGWDAEGSHASRLSFEIYGGIRARELLLEWGADKDVADEVCEAIVRHTEDSNTGSVRLMTALCQLGPSQDFRAILTPSLIHPADVQTICTLYPRLGLIEHHDDLMRKEMEIKKGCIACMWAPTSLSQCKAGIAAYDGLQGKMSDDKEWADRRRDEKALYELLSTF